MCSRGCGHLWGGPHHRADRRARIPFNAFAAYAGILNSAWNTGVNANTQVATNIAAQGTVTFSSDGGIGDGGD